MIDDSRRTSYQFTNKKKGRGKKNVDNNKIENMNENIPLYPSVIIFMRRVQDCWNRYDELSVENKQKKEEYFLLKISQLPVDR